MSFWSRIGNVFRGERLGREIEEELRSHVAEAIEQGRDSTEARRAFGSSLRHHEASRDVRVIPWLESLRADAVFGWRQVRKRKAASCAAVLSLGLAIGACASAFRLIDATLLRPLPVSHPERLYLFTEKAFGPDGKLYINHAENYPMFRQMRALVKDQADLIAISGATRIDLTYSSGEETEKAYRQYVSGWMFESFGLRPALGRVLSENDDLTPGAHPVAVLSYDYWTRRFGRDPGVVGRTFRTGNEIYQVLGVAQEPFAGVEPGTVTDIFVPTMMMENNAIARFDYRWFRTFVHLKPGVPLAPVAEKLAAAFHAHLEETVKFFAGMPKQERDGYLSQRLVLDPAAAGASVLQKDYGTALAVLAALVALVLLIASANVANLLTGQAAARQREMALRVSIGAGRRRLVQLVLVECGWIGLLAAALGAAFAWWSAPMVAEAIGTPGNPVRLILPADWRVLGFGVALALAVTAIFGLAPALHASGVKPAAALKGGEDPHSRRRLMRSLLAMQVAFCFVVLFAGGLFVKTAESLTRQSTGFSDARLLTVETVTARPQPAAFWDLVTARLRSVRGIEAAALCEWPLMMGGSWNGFISIGGATPDPIATYFLSVSPEWRDVMRIPLLSGRDFRPEDKLPGSALVNLAFARQYSGGSDPVGRSFEWVSNEGHRSRFEIVGLVGDARYRDMREPIQPTAYFPFSLKYSRGTFIVRTASAKPLELSSLLRQEVAKARPGFRVSNIQTQAALVEQHTVRERLLAALAVFFGAVALLLAGVGLYGVLDYSVVQRRREIGIRMAIGARPGDVAWRVTSEFLVVLGIGAVAGAALGLEYARYIDTLLYQVKPGDAFALALPSLAILGGAFVAAFPAVVRAVRIDPAIALRSE